MQKTQIKFVILMVEVKTKRYLRSLSLLNHKFQGLVPTDNINNQRQQLQVSFVSPTDKRSYVFFSQLVNGFTKSSIVTHAIELIAVDTVLCRKQEVQSPRWLFKLVKPRFKLGVRALCGKTIRNSSGLIQIQFET